MKFLGRNADNRHRMAVEINGLADHSGVAVETPHPVRIAKNKNWIFSRRLAFRRKENAAQQRLDSK